MNELKTEEDVRELIEDHEYENVIIFSNPDYASAFMGISEDGRAVYDYEKMIDYLMEKENWSDNEAVEFIEYNTIRALPYMGSSAPIIMYSLAYL